MVRVERGEASAGREVSGAGGAGTSTPRASNNGSSVCSIGFAAACGLRLAVRLRVMLDSLDGSDRATGATKIPAIGGRSSDKPMRGAPIVAQCAAGSNPGSSVPG